MHNNGLMQFGKGVSLPIFAIMALLWAIQQQWINLQDWHAILRQAPALLFAGAIIVALRFNQTRIVYPLCVLLLSWAMTVDVAQFKYLKFDEQLWFVSLLVIFTAFSFDLNKSIWGRHGLMRGLVILLVVAINYRFNHSITVEQWLNQQYIDVIPKLNSFGQIELLASLTALLAIMFRQLLKPSKITLYSWIVVFFLVFFKMFAVNLDMQLFGLALFGGLFIQAVLADSYHMAFTDELTGLAARRALLQSSLSLGKQYTVAMMDVDHFKKFNDTYGHDVGDQVLRMVASKLSQVRGGGKAYRYGGEEFTIIFPNKSVAYAIPYLEQVREAIACYQMTIRSDDRPDDSKEGKSQRKQPQSTSKTVNVTISIGVAEREGELKDFDQVLKQADEALYRAKQAGRNCLAE